MDLLNLGISGFATILVLAIGMSSIPAFAEENYDYDWNVILGDNLKDDPMAQMILQNIEISKQKIVDMQNKKIELTERQKFIEEQRKIAEAEFQAQLDRMNKKHDAFSPRNSFAKYVDKQPLFLHDYLWEMFEYLDTKVNTAKDLRDQALDNGASKYEARQIFVENAAIPKAERIAVVEKLNEKYGFGSFVSDIDDFNALPEEYRNQFTIVNDYESLMAPHVANADETEIIPVKTISSESQILQVTLEENVLDVPTTETVMNLDGEKYLTQEVEVMDEISEFTLSAWIKPEYKDGIGSELAIISKAKAFSLSVTNNPLTPNVLRLSLFDGIKWTVIESTSTLGEDWIHVAVTLDESTIKLYLNGELEAVQEIDGIPTLNSYGFLEPSPVDIISTDTKVIIGAQEFEKKNTIKYKNYFSGDIDQVIIQDKMLDYYEIIDLCHSSVYFSA